MVLVHYRINTFICIYTLVSCHDIGTHSQLQNYFQAGTGTGWSSPVGLYKLLF